MLYYQQTLHKKKDTPQVETSVLVIHYLQEIFGQKIHLFMKLKRKHIMNKYKDTKTGWKKKQTRKNKNSLQKN